MEPQPKLTDNRVRLGQKTQNAITPIMAELDCGPQEALERYIERTGTNRSLSEIDREWFDKILGQVSREIMELVHETRQLTQACLTEVASMKGTMSQRFLGVEESLNATRLLLAVIFEHQGSDEQLELQRKVDRVLDRLLGPLPDDPKKILAEALEMERQKQLLLDGQAVRQQEGGDGRALDEMEWQEPERDR